jgi:RNA polymerase sigma-70 factor, ECF subfamily
MSKPSMQNVTQLLQAWSDGDQEALAKLTPLIYAELHRLARRYMAQERPGHLLQTSALVNEAFIRLIDWQNVRWQNRAHFFGVSAQLMRRILVDFARTQNYAKRGGEALRVSLSEAAAVPDERSTDLVALDEALAQLAVLDPRQSQVVEMKFFGGLEMEEIAEVLNVSLGTIKRDWSLAKLWLLRQLNGPTEQRDER